MAGATPLGNMVVKLDLDEADFGKGVANSKKQVTYLAKEMSANMKIADMAGDKLGKLGNKYDGLTQIMKAQQGQVAALKKAYDESFVDGKATESTKRLAIQLQDANGKLAGYQGQLQNTAGQLARYKVETDGLTGKLNAFGDNAIANGKKLTAIGDGASKVGGALTKSVTIPLIAVGAAAVKASIDYESAFAGVKKTVDEQVDANGKVIISYDDLSNGIRAMAKEIPASASEIAAVVEVAGQLGIKTKDVLSFSKTMVDLGESTNLSATDAATAIAKIANITGMTSDEYRRFGSSVTALGNNFATTESDIVEMDNRLASAGTLAGLTNQEILGLATSMSSVGIEAEAGGTAMTQTLTAIEQAAVSGGEQLDKFASIAGMSSEQFTTTWKNKPIEAIQAFIKGLGELDSKGESATLVLDEMGLSGVRQSNMLKSLALASDTMTSAVDTSNKAWSENTALTKEANTRYETTESKLKMLKNEVTDVAIEFGGPLVDALRDGVQAAKPVIQFLGDMAKKFSSLDKEQQQNIIKWGLIAASAGPALKIFGSITSAVGGTATNIGKLSKNLIGLAAKAADKKAVASMAAEITTLGTSAASAGGSLAGGAGAAGGASLVAGLGAIAVPAAIAVVAIAAVGVAAYAGTKAYEAHQLAGAKWGTEVTKEQDKVITKSYELGSKAKADVAAYADGVKGSADDVVKSNNAIVDSIQKTVEKEAERRKKNAEKIEDPEARKRAEEYADYKAKLDQKTVDSAKVTVGNINKIMADASQNNRNLSTEEKNFIAENYRSLSDDQLKAAGFTKTQRIAIESAYQKDISKLSDKQLQDRAANVMKGLDKEKNFYDKQKSYLKEVYGEGTESYKKEMTNLNETNHKNTETMILGLARLTKAQGLSLENMSGAWEKYGWTTEEVAALVENSSVDSSKEAENLGNILKTMDRDWDSVKLDPKTGKVTVEGKEDLIQSLLETDKWKDLTLDEKKLLVNGDEARIAFLDSATEANKWEQYQILAKEISIENRSAIQAILETQGGLDKWNALQPDEKELLAKNDGLLKNVLASEESLNAWRALPVETKQILADSGNLYSVLTRSEEDMNKWKEIPDPIKKILGDNSSFIQTDSEAKAALSVWQSTPDPIKKILADNTNAMSAIVGSKENLDIWLRMPEEAKKLLGDNQNFLSSKEGATAELQKWANNNPAAKDLNANNRVTGPVDAANAKIVTLSGKTVYLYSDNQVADGVEAAKRKLAELPTYRGISIGIERVGGGEKLPPGIFNAKGTPGLPQDQWAIVNDQKGALYEELITLPNGFSFIPKGRDVMLPLPKNTRIDKASDTEKIKRGLPHFAEGLNNQQPLPFIGYNATFRKQDVSNSTNTKVINNSPVININNPVFNSEKDIRKTLQDAAFILNIDERGSMNG